MRRGWRGRRLDELFEVRSGDFHATAELDPGGVPLISCGDGNNGLVGFFGVPSEKTYERGITVAYNGQPLTAKFHPYRFGAKDDVGVLVPRGKMQDSTLLYVAGVLNRMKWRYSYGRKCFQKKLSAVVIAVPVRKDNGVEVVDEGVIEGIFPRGYKEFVPAWGGSRDFEIPEVKWGRFRLVEILKPARGDFHSIGALDAGPHMTVSRVTEDNGVVGYFARPEGAKIYGRGVITVSTVGGDAFVQLDEFMATDNVIVCTPKDDLTPGSLFFIAFVLNRQKWRYSYGRQCYMEKLSQVEVELPVMEDGRVDQGMMGKIVGQSPYWREVERRLVRG